MDPPAGWGCGAVGVLCAGSLPPGLREGPRAHAVVPAPLRGHTLPLRPLASRTVPHRVRVPESGPETVSTRVKIVSTSNCSCELPWCWN